MHEGRIAKVKPETVQLLLRWKLIRPATPLELANGHIPLYAYEGDWYVMVRR